VAKVTRSDSFCHDSHLDQAISSSRQLQPKMSFRYAKLARTSCSKRRGSLMANSVTRGQIVQNLFTSLFARPSSWYRMRRRARAFERSKLLHDGYHVAGSRCVVP